MLRWIAGLGLGVVLTGAAACHGSDTARLRALDTPAAQRLVGVWNITVWPGQAFNVRTGTDPSVRGTIALIGDRHHPLSFSRITAPLHDGIYDIDFSPFAFVPDAPGTVPLAVAEVSASAGHVGSGREDHVRIVLDPDDARRAIILDGTLVGDSVTGAWFVDSRTASGGGGFTMVRQRTRWH
jgi:hypothetical protein